MLGRCARLSIAPLALLTLLLLSGCESVSIAHRTADGTSQADFYRWAQATGYGTPQFDPGKAPPFPGDKFTDTRITYTSMDGAKLAQYMGAAFQFVNGQVPGGIVPWATGLVGAGGSALAAWVIRNVHNKAWEESRNVHSPPPPAKSVEPKPPEGKP